jgi:hypothetical protein
MPDVRSAFRSRFIERSMTHEEAMEAIRLIDALFKESSAIDVDEFEEALMEATK